MLPETEQNEEILGEPEGLAPEGEQPQTETPQEQAPEEKLLRVTVRATGKQYVGKTERDIMQQMEDDLARMSADAQTRESQAREVRGKVQYQQERGEAYDDQKYLDLLGKDTMAARRYQDRFYYGMGEDEDPAIAFRMTYETADRIRDTLEIAEFKRTTLGPDGKPIAMSEQEASAVLQEIDRSGMQLNAGNLASVYYRLMGNGVIQRPQGDGNQKFEDIELRPRSRGEGAPRGTTGSGASTTQSGLIGGKTMAEIEAMPKAELDAFMRKHGLLQH